MMNLNIRIDDAERKSNQDLSLKIQGRIKNRISLEISNKNKKINLEIHPANLSPTLN